MSINDSKKADFIWKKVIYGRTQTGYGFKEGPEEQLVSPLQVLKNWIYAESDQIPIPASSTSNSVVSRYYGIDAVQLAIDPTIPEPRTYIAVTNPLANPYLDSNRLKNWIPPTVDSTYRVRVYAGDPNNGGILLNELATDNEYVFDYSAGVLYFPNDIPSATSNGVWIEGYRYIGLMGFPPGGNTLETPSDGDFSDGAIKNWVIGSTTYSDALDDLNELLALLLPSQPPPLSSKTLNLSVGGLSRGGISILRSSGVADNTSGGSPSDGQNIWRTIVNDPVSSTISEFHDGTQGTLEALSNDAVIGSVSFTKNNDDSGTYGGLTVISDDPYPSGQPGFWEAISASMQDNGLNIGVNKYQMCHSSSGCTNERFFIIDDLTALPVTSSVDVTEDLSGTYDYSSGVPHYSTGAILSVDATVSNLAGKTYLATDIIQIMSTPSVGSLVNIDPGQSGLPTILPDGFAPFNLTDEPFVIGGDVHATSNIRVRGRNPHGDGSFLTNSTFINVMSGSPVISSGGPVVEYSVPVINMGNNPNSDFAGRITMTDGDTPTDDKSSLVAPDWISTSSLNPWDAAVVGGVLRCDQTDYSGGSYLPVGPDLSGQNSVQYITFFFRRVARSQFDIEIDGTYSGCWVKLPNIGGLNDTLNGWWDMFSLYSGAGVPDAGVNGPGCALGTVMSGSSGTFRCTFGTQSSTNSSNNIIMVRLRLDDGDVVNGLRFLGV
ncbi:MAG: hypothetical protein WC284_10905 [Candidimonas sp.]